MGASCWLRAVLSLLADVAPVANALPSWQQQHRGAPPAPAGPPSELNVRQFGARGDGVTPDDAAIQAAIDAAAAYATHGTGSPAVYFPRGVYLLTKTLVVSAAGNSTSSAIRLTGDGRQASHVVAAEGLRGATMLQYGSDSAAGFVEDGGVSALGFDGRNVALHCITAYAKHSVFTGLLLRQSTAVLVRFESGFGNSFEGSHYDCGASSSECTGVCLQGSTASNAVKIADNTFVDFTTAVSLAGGVSVRVVGNEFTGLTPTNRTKPPTLVLSSITGLTISANTFATGGSPTGSNPDVQSVYGCSDILLSGASAGNTSNPCSGVSISTNVFNPVGYEHICSYSAIMLGAAERVSVADNTNAAAYPGFNLLGTGADSSSFYTADIHVQGEPTNPRTGAPMVEIRPAVAPAAAPAAPPAACTQAVQKACGTAKEGDECLACCGGHSSALHAAGCNQSDFSSFCNRSRTTPAGHAALPWSATGCVLCHPPAFDPSLLHHVMSFPCFFLSALPPSPPNILCCLIGAHFLLSLSTLHVSGRPTSTPSPVPAPSCGISRMVRHR